MVNNSILIITGYSGSGKTTFTKILEDMGFFCIDNLPADLFIPFLEILRKTKAEEMTKIALVIDIRDERLIRDFPEIYKKAKNKGVNIDIIFLSATNDSLILRYKRTRRPHPLYKKYNSLEKSIEEEKKALEPIKRFASHLIDTSDKTPQDLKNGIIDILKIDAEKNSFLITLESFGFLNGIPERADLVIDVRSLPNPYYVDKFKTKTGKNREVIDFLFGFKETIELLDKTKSFLDFFIKQTEKDRYYITIAIGCSGGKHRSVAIVENLAKHYKKLGYNINIIHRDIMR
jgi:UPF0042 nucleotide-binding protein